MSTSDFRTQHCEWDPPDTCDTHNGEDNGWVAVDPGDVNSVDGMETGTVTIDGGTSTGDTRSVSFSSSFSSTPLVFAQIQTENGGNRPLNAQVKSVGTSGFTAEFCEQESDDSCDGHTTETLAWWAIDPSVVDETSGFEFGTVSVSDSLWNSISFTQSFSSTPVVIAMTQTENGGQEALYPEVDSVTTSGADIRYCEGYDQWATNPEDECEGHVSETVAWLAVEPGSITVDDSTGGGSGAALPFSDDFNDGTIDTSKWTVSHFQESGQCGYSSSPYALLSGGNGLRHATTIALDTSGGGSIEFDHRFTTQPDNPCTEDADRDGRLRYSTDGGSSWTTISTFDDGTVTTWTAQDIAIPTGAKTTSTKFRWTQGDVWGQHWVIDDVLIDSSGGSGGGGGGNSAPTADFTYSCTNLDCSFDGSSSSDSDGSISSYDWDFGDGATGSGKTVAHTYSCGGTFTVTLTVTDDGGATDSTSKDVSVSDADSDGDGLSDCEETDIYGTNPNDADTDDDEFWDMEEVVHFVEPNGNPNTNTGIGSDAEAEDVFCGSGGSPCAWPDPLVPDVYLEVDGWSDCGLFGTDCDTHAMSDTTRNTIENVFSDRGIQAHIDNGQFDNGAIAGGGQIIDDGERTESMDELENKYASSNSYFDDDRRDIWHYMIYVHELTQNEGDVARACGIGNSPGFFSGVAHGDHFSSQPPDCYDPASQSDSLVITTLQEFGHNDLYHIEPDGDWCGGDKFHDEKTDYIMAVEACGEHKLVDHHGNRWTEYAEFVDTDECTSSDGTDNDPATCPSPGDLNKGVR